MNTKLLDLLLESVDQEQELIDSGQAEIVYKDNDKKIVKINTFPAAQFYDKDRWWQLIIVKQNGLHIPWIKNPLPLVQSAACSNKPDATSHILPPACMEPSLREKYKEYLT